MNINRAIARIPSPAYRFSSSTLQHFTRLFGPYGSVSLLPICLCLPQLFQCTIIFTIKDFAKAQLISRLTQLCVPHKLNCMLKKEFNTSTPLHFSPFDPFHPGGALRSMPRPPVQHRMYLNSALFLSQRLCVVPLVHRGRRGPHFPTTAPVTARVAWVNVYGAGDGLDRPVTEIMEGLWVQEGLLLPQALLEELPFVSELDHRLCVGVQGGDRCSHAAGKGPPGHTNIHKHRKTMRLVMNKNFISVYSIRTRIGTMVHFAFCKNSKWL